MRGFYHYNLGVALLKNGQYNDAFKELSEALKLNPDNFEARCALADVHSELGRSLGLEGRTEEAIAEFREAIAINRATRSTMSILARRSWRSGRLLPVQRARQALRRCGKR